MSRLLLLPAELRLKIYYVTISDCHNAKKADNPDREKTVGLAIPACLTSCRQTYTEAQEIFYETTTFTPCRQRSDENLLAPPESLLQRIKNLEFNCVAHFYTCINRARSGWHMKLKKVYAGDIGFALTDHLSSLEKITFSLEVCASQRYTYLRYDERTVNWTRDIAATLRKSLTRIRKELYAGSGPLPVMMISATVHKPRGITTLGAAWIPPSKMGPTVFHWDGEWSGCLAMVECLRDNIMHDAGRI